MSGAVAKPGAFAPTAVLPPGCDLDGCRYHYAPGRNMAAEGCICPAWFDGGGWHLLEWNSECGAHLPAELPARGPAASRVIVDEPPAAPVLGQGRESK